MQFLFQEDGIAWKLLRDDPDRYIYEPVCQGVNIPLPKDIEAGINDVSKRDCWNKPAAPDYALPTETWREHIARRNRCLELRQKLADGEINSINDLITYNLNIRQLAQDVIENCYDPELVWAFYQAITKITILDPTCGSGAFLFSALNILEPLYEACFEQMQMFLDEGFVPENENCVQLLEKFRQILEQVNSHHNRHYSIIKSIVINNLYGVDIMQEATEICKLRLFLKLTSQVEPNISKPNNGIEPLPDIDFNIRAGNTLVGFTSLNEVRGVIAKESDGQIKLVYDKSVVARIEAEAQEVDCAFQEFRNLQTIVQIDSGAISSKKTELRTGINQLRKELDCYLADEYEMGLSKKTAAFENWKESHKPFHWFVEFYNIIKNGGFDVIIGNPPYVEYRLVKSTYKLKQSSYNSENANNLYAFCMERSCFLLSHSGYSGMIIPAGVLGLDDAVSLREVLLKRFTDNFCSTYAIRPSKLFDGVDQRLCIYIGKFSKESKSKIWTTQYHHWNSEERNTLFSCLEYNDSFHYKRLERIPQLGSSEAASILAKLESKSRRLVSNYFASNRYGYLMHYHRSPRYWIRAMDFEQYFKSPTKTRSIHHFRNLYFNSSSEGKVVGALLNSSLFFFWFVSVGNGRNITGSDIENFPLDELNQDILKDLPDIFDQLMLDYKANSFIRVRQDCEFQEFRPSLSKPTIDKIDGLLARHYDFTDRELDFIINYDIKYRMRRDSEDESSSE